MTWVKHAGIFKDDSDFAEIADELQAERTSDDESEVDPNLHLKSGNGHFSVRW